MFVAISRYSISILLGIYLKLKYRTGAEAE